MSLATQTVQNLLSQLQALPEEDFNGPEWCDRIFATAPYFRDEMDRLGYTPENISLSALCAMIHGSLQICCVVDWYNSINNAPPA
jgi:hypothetical protein